MVDPNQVFLRWALRPEAQRVSIMKKVLNEYGNIIYKVADDIFDSCIEDYYASYKPKKYKRHNNIVGFNLYSLKDMSFDGTEFQIGFDSDFLLKYGTKEDIREEVMNAVFAGQRGVEERRSSKAENVWPMKWTTSYPNEFSQYTYWKSKHTTMDEIFNDFVQNAIKDTKDLFWDTLNKYV